MKSIAKDFLVLIFGGIVTGLAAIGVSSFFNLENRYTNLSSPVQLNVWDSRSEFIALSPVETLRSSNFQISRILVERKEDGERFYVFVIPPHKIPVGSTVRVLEMKYPQSRILTKNILVAK